MEKLSLLHEKITVTGPTNEINSLVVYLEDKGPGTQVIKSSPHFPFWKSLEDLYLLVSREELTEALGRICSRLKSSSIYRGWIDFSQTLYPICASSNSENIQISRQ